MDSGPAADEDGRQFLGVRNEGIGGSKSGSESGSIMGRISRNGTLTKGLLRLMNKK